MMRHFRLKAPRTAAHGQRFTVDDTWDKEAIEDKALSLFVACVSIDYEEIPVLPGTPGLCRVCGCTDQAVNDDCLDDNGNPCSWVEPDLCSACDPDTSDKPRDVLAKQLAAAARRVAKARTAPVTKRKPATKGT